jgi:hypothetical protein
MGEACSMHGNDVIYVKILLEKPEGKRPLGRIMHIC